MKMKNDILGFEPESRMFFAAAENGDICVVAFGDNCKHTEKARELTNALLENDKTYSLLSEIATSDSFGMTKERDIQYRSAFQTKTDVWSILFHYFLIEELKENGFKILTAPKDFGIQARGQIIID